jgi:hypothetical protein
VLGVQARDVGYAGMKDRHATTRQWLSLPGVACERARGSRCQGMRVLEVSRHRNKLRVGHFARESFRSRPDRTRDGDAKRIAVALDELVAKGVPNRYGHQRFGATGTTSSVGWRFCAARAASRIAASASCCFHPCNRLSSIGCLICARTRAALLACAAGTFSKRSPPAGNSTPRMPSRIRRASTLAKSCPRRLCPGARARRPSPAARRVRWRIGRSPTSALVSNELAQVGRSLPGTRRPVVVKLTLDEPAFATMQAPAPAFFAAGWELRHRRARRAGRRAGKTRRTYASFARGAAEGPEETETMHISEHMLAFTNLGSEWVLWLLVFCPFSRSR